MGRLICRGEPCVRPWHRRVFSFLCQSIMSEVVWDDSGGSDYSRDLGSDCGDGASQPSQAEANRFGLFRMQWVRQLSQLHSWRAQTG
jgi:hypothetical protein